MRAKSTANLPGLRATDGRIAARSLGDPIEIARDLAFLSSRCAIKRERTQSFEIKSLRFNARNRMFIGLEPH
jgi:hypothetical protein